MDNHGIGDMTEKALEKLKSIMDVNTVIGSAINCPDGTIVIPFSRVSMGYGGGGGNANNEKHGASGLGNGIGVKIDPVGFLVISEGSVRLLNIEGNTNTAIDKLVDTIPMVVSKVDGFIKDRKAAKEFSE